MATIIIIKDNDGGGGGGSINLGLIRADRNTPFPPRPSPRLRLGHTTETRASSSSGVNAGSSGGGHRNRRAAYPNPPGGIPGEADFLREDVSNHRPLFSFIPILRVCERVSGKGMQRLRLLHHSPEGPGDRPLCHYLSFPTLLPAQTKRHCTWWLRKQVGEPGLGKVSPLPDANPASPFQRRWANNPPSPNNFAYFTTTGRTAPTSPLSCARRRNAGNRDAAGGTPQASPRFAGASRRRVPSYLV